MHGQRAAAMSVSRTTKKTASRENKQTWYFQTLLMTTPLGASMLYSSRMPSRVVIPHNGCGHAS
jgi:hypothetical protein